MLALGLTSAEEEAYKETLRSSHRIRVGVTILDRDEAPVAELADARVLSGGVQVDADADVTRSLSLSVLDPGRQLQFDSANPADGAVYASHHVAVTYGVWVPALERWVDAPVFSGPLTKFSHVGGRVTLEAQGKETLGLDPHLVTAGYTVPAAYPVADAIALVMGKVGERRTHLGMVTGQLSTFRTVIPGEAPWDVCVGGSTDADGNPVPALMSKADGAWFLFYDGRGVLTAKLRKANTAWVFDDRQVVGGPPEYDYDVLSFRNHAEVTGNLVTGAWSLPAEHPLSPQALARNGQPRRMTIFHESDALLTQQACVDKARLLVEAVAFQGLDAKFECLPVPHLEEKDDVLLLMPDYGVSFKADRFTIPLTPDTPMSIGFNRRIRKPGAR